MFLEFLFHYLSKSRQSNELDNFLKQWFNSHDIFEKHFLEFLFGQEFLVEIVIMFTY